MNTIKRILLVEDQAKEVELALVALEAHQLSHFVAVARDGVEALDYLYARGKFADRPPGLPSVLLLDIKMPRLSGMEFLWQLKGDPRLRRIPVVMLTSSRQPADLARSYEFGACAYVVKPLEASQFAETLKQLVTFWAVVNELPPALVPQPA